MLDEIEFDVEEELAATPLTLAKATILAMAFFSAGYMASEPNLDGFNLEEALEYINNTHLDSIPIHIAGFVTSFLANVPMLAAIIYCWIKDIRHHQAHGGHAHHHHEHSTLEELGEYLAIGGPFALMGTAAAIDTLNDFTDVSKLTVFQKVLAYTATGISGMITAFGATKLHGFHVHAQSEENGGGLKGFFNGLYKTFFVKVWAAKDNQDTKLKKTLAVCNEAWKKYGIVAVHGLLGSFAADVFLSETGIEGEVPAFDYTLKVLLPLAVMIFEGNTEARSLDQERDPISYSLLTRLTVIASGWLHTIPSITALAIMMGSSDSGPGNGILYNTLIYSVAALVLTYPSVYGFKATTIHGYSKAANGAAVAITNGATSAINSLKTWVAMPQRNYTEINSAGASPSLYSRLLNMFGFHQQPANADDESPPFLLSRRVEVPRWRNIFPLELEMQPR